MADVWFTADNHFGHQAIIGHCDRPWMSFHEMDACMMEIWNQYVKPQDTVYVIGDFMWNSNMHVVDTFQKKLNGGKVFLKGNHDRWIKKDKRYMHHKKLDKIHLWMCHYPLASWPSGVNLHGHCHGTMPKHPNRIDVGVDTNPEYRPYHWEEIKAMIDYDVLTRRQREGRDD